MTLVVQAGFLLAVVVVGSEFTRWVHGLEAGRVVGERPPGVEAFLPIAALLSLRHFVTSGEVHPVHSAGLAILLIVVGISVPPTVSPARKPRRDMSSDIEALLLRPSGTASVRTLPPTALAP